MVGNNIGPRHDLDPGPFNPEYRPGFKEALDQSYREYCDQHPKATQEHLAQAHTQIAEDLKFFYPPVGDAR